MAIPSKLYLPGELIENNDTNTIVQTQFTKTGNLLIQNDFIENAETTAAYSDHFEAYELIEY